MKRIRRYQPSLLLTFSVVSFVLIALLGVALAFGLQNEIEQTALRQEAWVATDLVNNNIVPIVRSEDLTSPIIPGSARYNGLDPKIKDVMARNHIARVKIWAKDGIILYSDVPDLIGKKFEVEDDLIEAFGGQVHSDVSNLDADENQFEKKTFDRLLELYLPLRISGSAEPTAVFEVYHDMAAVDARNNEIRNFAWLALSVGFLALYGSLFLLVFRASRTINRRNREN